MVGLLASSFLDREPVRDSLRPRLTWNTEAIVQEAGGRPIMSKTGMPFSRLPCERKTRFMGGNERSPLFSRFRFL